ncbi:MAG: hypothetical protein ACK6EB_07240 [Planctomyces sp.]|jgi:hypothetical protein
MALPNKVLPGFTATLWAQSAATPTTLSTANLAVWTAQVQNIVGTAAGGLGTTGMAIPVEAIPAFGQDDAVVNYSVAGARQSDKIPAQSAPTSLTITAAWNPADTALIQIRTDAYSGTVDRTYVIAAYDGTNVVAYAFNGRAAQWQIDAQPGAEAKATFTIHPRGGQFGWSNN